VEPCGVLVTGVHEALPKSLQGLVPWFPAQKIYCRKI
jgi:hypothetical protein